MNSIKILLDSKCNLFLCELLLCEIYKTYITCKFPYLVFIFTQKIYIRNHFYIQIYLHNYFLKYGYSSRVVNYVLKIQQERQSIISYSYGFRD
jgi:hypothetical protein